MTAGFGWWLSGGLWRKVGRFGGQPDLQEVEDDLLRQAPEDTTRTNKTANRTTMNGEMARVDDPEHDSFDDWSEDDGRRTEQSIEQLR